MHNVNHIPKQLVKRRVVTELMSENAQDKIKDIAIIYTHADWSKWFMQMIIVSKLKHEITKQK